jgi:hypothetical protein
MGLNAAHSGTSCGRDLRSESPGRDRHRFSSPALEWAPSSHRAHRLRAPLVRDAHYPTARTAMVKIVALRRWLYCVAALRLLSGPSDRRAPRLRMWRSAGQRSHAPAPSPRSVHRLLRPRQVQEQAVRPAAQRRSGRKPEQPKPDPPYRPAAAADAPPPHRSHGPLRPHLRHLDAADVHAVHHLRQAPHQPRHLRCAPQLTPPCPALRPCCSPP